MFDKMRVTKLTELLNQLSTQYPKVFLMMNENVVDVIPMLRLANFNIIAILTQNQTDNQKVFGVPIMNLSTAVKYFDSATMIIQISNTFSPSPLQSIQFQFEGRMFNVPTLIISSEEVSGMLDRITMINFMNQYNVEGENIIGNPLIRLMRGIETFIGIDQILKLQISVPQIQTNQIFNIDDVGIVIQGPLMNENNFTFRTALTYRQHYPNCPIVISTWKDSASEDFKVACKEISVDLIENDLPEDPAYCHVNHQLKSSTAGVIYMMNHKIKYILKTRTDQRMHRVDFLMYFRNLLLTFPAFGNKLQGRLIVINNSNMHIWIPFFINDFLTFGFVDDIVKLYSVKFQTTAEGESKYIANHMKRYEYIRSLFKHLNFNFYSELKPNHKLLNYNRMIKRFVTPEAYFMKSLYENYIAPIDYDEYLQTYWQFVKDYLIVVDSETIMFDWQKYNSYFTYHCDDGSSFDQSTWLNLYNHQIKVAK